MQIALAQINTVQGDIPGNLKIMKDAIHKAADRGARLIVFPELSLCGYCPRDVLFLSSFVGLVKEATRELVASTPADTAVLFGSIDQPEPRSGSKLLNTACLIQNGEATHVAAKRHLPNYDVFDEARYFVPGGGNAPIQVDGINIGVTICEDIWGEVEGDPGMPRYQGDPPSELVAQGAELVINLSASPFSVGKIETRRNLVREHAKRLAVPFALCNLVGGNDEVLFDGSSHAVNADGDDIASAATFSEDLVYFEHDSKITKLIVPPTENAAIYRALVLGVQDYARKSGFKKAVLGLSGGIDSALTAAIAAQALGGENVLGVSMPSRYSADMSHDDAKELAENLNMPFKVIPIGQVFDAALSELKPHFDGLPSDVTEENIQPRIRGMYLMALSNKHHALLLSTGNKSELAVGYCTLYGDMCGGLAVISDLPKKKVYDLCEFINSQGDEEVIPSRTITRAPSAELRPDQKDTDSLPDYDVLDEILRLAVEEGHDLSAIVEAGFDQEVVKDILGKLWRNEFKRKQMPPGLKVTTKAFGVGRRMPLTGGAPWSHEISETSHDE